MGRDREVSHVSIQHLNSTVVVINFFFKLLFTSSIGPHPDAPFSCGLIYIQYGSLGWTHNKQLGAFSSIHLHPHPTKLPLFGWSPNKFVNEHQSTALQPVLLL